MAEKERFVNGICVQDHPKRPGSKRYKATYYIYEALPNGKTRQKVQKTGWYPTEEEARRQAKLRSVSTADAREALKKPVRLKDVMDRYKKDKATEVDRSARTHISRFNVLERTWNNVLDNPDIRKLEIADFRSYRTYLLNEYHGSENRTHELLSGEGGRISWNYYDGLRRTLIMLMTYAEETGMIGEEISSIAIKGMKARKPKEPKSSKIINAQEGKAEGSLKYLTVSQLEDLVRYKWKQIEQNDYQLTINRSLNQDYEYLIIYQFAFYTGLRPEEWTVIEVDDIEGIDQPIEDLAPDKDDFAINAYGDWILMKEPADRIPLYEVKVNVDKAFNSRYYGVESRDVKSNNAERKIPIMSHRFLTALKAYIEVLRSTEYFQKGGRFLFPSPTGAVISPTTRNRILKTDCINALGGKYVTFYGFRHSFAQWMYDDLNLSYDSAVTAMGHADSELLRKVYTSQTVEIRYKKLRAEVDQKAYQVQYNQLSAELGRLTKVLNGGGTVEQLRENLQKEIDTIKRDLEDVAKNLKYKEG